MIDNVIANFLNLHSKSNFGHVNLRVATFVVLLLVESHNSHLFIQILVPLSENLLFKDYVFTHCLPIFRNLHFYKLFISQLKLCTTTSPN